MHRASDKWKENIKNISARLVSTKLPYKLIFLTTLGGGGAATPPPPVPYAYVNNNVYWQII